MQCRQVARVSEITVWDMLLAEEKNMDTPRISIITLSLNCGEVIEKTILSVLEQSYQQVEYIILDGGSTDYTTDIIKRYADRISYWISEPDGGITAAMNKGIRQAQGEVIGIIHAGDWYEPGAFGKLVAAYRTRAADIYYGDVRFQRVGSAPIDVATDSTNLLLKMSVAHPGVFITRQAYQQHGSYNGDYKLAMDYELLLRMYRNGAYFKKMPGIVANFSEDGISTRRWKRALAESLQIKNHYSGSRIEKILNYIFYSWILVGQSFKRQRMSRYK